MNKHTPGPIETRVRLPSDGPLSDLGSDLMQAARAYWQEFQKSELRPGAVVFVEDYSGALVLYTRGEYREQIMHNILPLSADADFVPNPPGLYDAAPDLLEACRDLLESIELALVDPLLPDMAKSVLRGFLHGADQRASAAIAKSDGRPPNATEAP